MSAPPNVTAVALKDPVIQLKVQVASCMIHLNPHTSVTWQCQSGLTMLSRHSVETCQRNCELIHNSFRNSCQQSSRLSEPLQTYPGHKSGTNACKLITSLKTKRKEKNTDVEWFIRPSLKNPCMQEKTPPKTTISVCFTEYTTEQWLFYLTELLNHRQRTVACHLLHPWLLLLTASLHVL